MAHRADEALHGRGKGLERRPGAGQGLAVESQAILPLLAADLIPHQGRKQRFQGHSGTDAAFPFAMEDHGVRDDKPDITRLFVDNLPKQSVVVGLHIRRGQGVVVRCGSHSALLQTNDICARFVPQGDAFEDGFLRQHLFAEILPETGLYFLNAGQEAVPWGHTQGNVLKITLNRAAPSQILHIAAALLKEILQVRCQVGRIPTKLLQGQRLVLRTGSMGPPK